jgi:glutaredoxin-related protein
MSYIVYGITDCPACLRACADLMELYPDKEYVFVETDFSKSYRNYLKDKYNWPTFPIVIQWFEHESVVIGGYEQLKDHIASLSAL